MDDYEVIKAEDLYELTEISYAVGSKVDETGVKPEFVLRFRGINIDNEGIEPSFVINTEELRSFAQYISEVTTQFLEDYPK